MTRQRYDIKEALNRILRILYGSSDPNEQRDTIAGEVLSENQAISDLAELLAGSLPNQTLTLPTAVTDALPSATTSQKGVAELSTNAEAVAGTDTERIVTPAGLAAAIAEEAHEYGEIYVATGTVTVSIGTSWEKVTGSFTFDGLSSDNIVPGYENDKITINKVGTYFVNFQAAFSGAANTTFRLAAYLDGIVQNGIRTTRKLGAGGDVGSCSVQGFISVTGTNMDIEIYAMADGASKDFTLESGQLLLEILPT